MKHRIAVLSAVYPSVLPFLPALVESLAAQTEPGFDWVVINDGVSKNLLGQLIGEKFSWKNLEMPNVSTATNRLQGIKYCQENDYEFVIFQDSDDWMSWNRVEDAVTHLSQESIVFNDLTLVDMKGVTLSEQVWKDRLYNNQLIDASFIDDKNCVGLGNAAIRSSILKNDLMIPTQIIAVDWYLFYHLLQYAPAVFSSNANVFYRQHENNSAGIGLLSEKRVRRTVLVKAAHYSALKEYFPALTRQQEKIKFLEKELIAKEEKLRKYIEENKYKGISSFWWEETNYQI